MCTTTGCHRPDWLETVMNEPSGNTSTRYRIGAVARLTGITPDTLRIWERRYAAVSPQRSPQGGRLYSAGDLERLRLMKQLVDAGDAIGEVAGLETGADDYLVKPFHVEELVARVRALIRRSAGVAQAEIVCGPICLNSSSQEVRVDGRVLELTAYEYRLLRYLMLNAGKVSSKAELTEHIYEEDQDRDSNVIEVFIGRLRKKLDPDNSINPIETLRGRGYRFGLERKQSA